MMLVLRLSGLFPDLGSVHTEALKAHPRLILGVYEACVEETRLGQYH